VQPKKAKSPPSTLDLLGQQKKKKVDPYVFLKLHRNQLKTKLLYKSEPDVYLS
jgi:hypothetical protein